MGAYGWVAGSWDQVDKGEIMAKRCRGLGGSKKRSKIDCGNARTTL